MPQIPKHRKVKRVTVLTKKCPYPRTYLKLKSFNPLCEKLKSNNHSLAKALSKEKHKTQLLFSQNVALVAEVQNLGLACNKRNAVISNILTNAKEMLTMIVTLTGHLTNTISACQEFVESPTANLRMSTNSTGKDTGRRLSTKSPTRGVVKPMVSGYTITKPTINLSRVNMQNINNPSNLRVIPEVATPPRNQELNSPRSPGHITMRQRRSDGARIYRMPERLNVTSPRHSDESERRLSKRTKRSSARMSGSISKSRKLSVGSSTPKSSRNSIENFEYIGSPTVKLNDVSKLLQNSQSINIRMLTENQSNQENHTLENNDSVDREDSQANIEMLESSPSDNSRNNNNQTIGSENKKIADNLNSTPKIQESMSRIQNTSDLEDPLEGPSWLFNNSSSVPSFKHKIQHSFHSFENEDKETDEVSISDNDSKDVSLNTAELSNASVNEESIQEISQLSATSRRNGYMYNLKKGKQINNENEYQIVQENINNGSFDNTLSTSDSMTTNEDECKVENEVNFITQRRVCFKPEEEEDDDDFTLMYMRPANVHFDINDLKLPVLEQSALKPIVSVEPEPEITTTLKLLPQIDPLPSTSNNSLDETIFNESTVKLPVLDNTENKEKKKKKSKKVASRESLKFVNGTSTIERKNNKKKKNRLATKDPSAAKVVLRKLNETDVKSRTPSPEVAPSQESTTSLSPYSRAENSSDSENSNTSINSAFALNRPRRKRAPTVLQEPSLKSKLRRNN